MTEIKVHVYQNGEQFQAPGLVFSFRETDYKIWLLLSCSMSKPRSNATNHIVVQQRNSWNDLFPIFLEFD